MQVLVCVKRVPATGARITVTEDGQRIETRNLGFTISPHEECAVEEAVRIVEAQGGEAAVLTLGPAEATEQLRSALAVGVERAILLATDDEEWDPRATARAITAAVREQEAAGNAFDILLFGNESADSGGYQVGVRVAHALDLPVVTGVKGLEIEGNVARARREGTNGWEVFEVGLPAVFTVKEGINLPRYPSVPGRLRAKKKPIVESRPLNEGGGLRKIRLVLPPEEQTDVEILGNGPDAAPRVLALLKELELV
ncbi:MAG: electron transfer flavoprotein subunit beta/FixA family protein [Anaerolineae bacterium]|nr:electron transfer flavoprotein subunit beta/FixA family protein [Anaerolineae bacterium]